MAKINRKKALKKLQPEYVKETAYIYTISNTTGNHRYMKLDDIKSRISGMTSNSKSIDVRRALYEMWRGTQNINWGYVKFMVVVAETGATFTDTNVSHGTDHRAALETCINKGFTFTLLKNTILMRPGQVIGYDGASSPVRSEPWFHSMKTANLNLTRFYKQLESEVDGLKNTEVPEMWLVAYSVQYGANTQDIECNVNLHWDEKARPLRPIL